MAIERRGNQWYFRFQWRGKEYREPTGLAATRENAAAAKEQETKYKANLQLGRVKQVSHIAFDVGCAQFLNWCETTQYRSKKNTYLRLKTSLASAVAFFGGRYVDEIDSNSVEDYKTFRASVNCVKDVTIRHDLYALSLFFRKYAVKRGWAAENPVAEVEKPSDEHAVRIHVLSREEESAYFGVASRNEDLYDLGRIMILQGCRPEEVLALRPDNVDARRNMLKVASKTPSGKRELEMTSETSAILAKRVARAKERGGKWLFPSPRKPGRHIVKLNGSHDQACLDAGVSFVLYDLRHTFATRMVTDPEVNADLATVAALLGHSGLRVVAKYLHPQAQTKSEAMKRYEKMLRAPLKRVK
jgi:integrase